MNYHNILLAGIMYYAFSKCHHSIQCTKFAAILLKNEYTVWLSQHICQDVYQEQK